MTDVIKLLDVADQEVYTNMVELEYDTVADGIPKQVKCRIAELNATNMLLVETEEEHGKLKTELEFEQLKLRNSEDYELKYKTLKQREEQSKISTKNLHEPIRKLERKQHILKSNKQGLEYELKFLLSGE